MGLPSGTKWKNFNETGFYTYDEAVSQFGSRLPTKAQWEEILSMCNWSNNGNGYKVTGPNGNSIVLPASGYFDDINERLVSVGYGGYYWTSTARNEGKSWIFHFYYGKGGPGKLETWLRSGRLSVRLVHD